LNKLSDIRLAVIGLGYVGLPVAVAFGQYRSVIGFDIKSERIHQLENGVDSTRETSREERLAAKGLFYTDRAEYLKDCNFFIVTVPTPINKSKTPNLEALILATETIASVLKRGDLVVYESTVYPGCTEEVCVPILEYHSGLKFNEDFFCGYSPERINPGDKSHRLTDIVKITSGSTPKAADLVDSLYREIISAGTYRAASIKIAEAAKVIENTQRDVNIALVNEFAMIFNRLGINTHAVLEAAGTKWNFMPFKPGLVGGHCIGVDPYYLTHKAQQVGYEPKMILAGRMLNDSMSSYVAKKLFNELEKVDDRQDSPFRILIMGLSFKENCPDIRNSQVVKLLKELVDLGCHVEAYDPWVDADEVMAEHDFKVCAVPEHGVYDAIVVAVAHDQFRIMGEEKIREFGKAQALVYDLKHMLSQSQSDISL
jgi:UDP-N-acetyl-D-galactosamine dehydrogenase